MTSFNNAVSSSEDEDEPDVIPRAEWQARPALRVRQFIEPPGNVLYSETDTKTCKTRRECTKLIQEIQNYHMDVRGLPDIQYHFMIGGDGNVYEGRGWENIGSISTKDQTYPEEMGTDVIEVAFIGDFKDTAPPKEMLKLASNLLLSAVRNNKLILREKAKSRDDVFLTEEQVEELKKNGNVEIRGYGVDTPPLDFDSVQRDEEERNK